MWPLIHTLDPGNLSSVASWTPILVISRTARVRRICVSLSYASSSPELLYSSHHHSRFQLLTLTHDDMSNPTLPSPLHQQCTSNIWTSASSHSLLPDFSSLSWSATLHVLIDIPPCGPLLPQHLQQISSKTERRLESGYYHRQKSSNHPNHTALTPDYIFRYNM